MKSFRPIVGSTVKAAATTSSARVALVQLPTGSFQLRMCNLGDVPAFINCGGSAVDATVTNMPLPAGAIEVITIGNNDDNPVTHVAAICASGAADVYFTIGEGI